jgi:hypothetical protein
MVKALVTCVEEQMHVGFVPVERQRESQPGHQTQVDALSSLPGNNCKVYLRAYLDRLFPVGCPVEVVLHAYKNYQGLEKWYQVEEVQQPSL